MRRRTDWDLRLIDEHLDMLHTLRGIHDKANKDDISPERTMDSRTGGTQEPTGDIRILTETGRDSSDVLASDSGSQGGFG